MTKPVTAVVAVLALAVSVLGGTARATASGGQYAPLNRPGPALSVPAAKLDGSLRCTADLANASTEPVLLSPATGVTPKLNYAWNYERAFTTEHRPFCTVRMPFHTLGNIATAGEYLVHAIRVMYARAGRRIAILGHSQGGMSMRWALRFWPDTRPMVADVIGMAGSNHGTTVPTPCIPDVVKCPPATWQQLAGSNFVAALNSRTETFPGIAYTEIFTHTDEVVEPNYSDAASSSALHVGRGAIINVSTQDICPLDVDEHLTIGTVDPAAYALVQDALTHAGPADPARIDSSVCTQVYQPGVDPSSAATYLDALAATPGLLSVVTPDVNVVGAPEVPGEPPLPCYVFAAGC